MSVLEKTLEGFISSSFPFFFFYPPPPVFLFFVLFFFFLFSYLFEKTTFKIFDIDWDVCMAPLCTE